MGKNRQKTRNKTLISEIKTAKNSNISEDKIHYRGYTIEEQDSL